MKTLLLAGVTALLMATGTAHAKTKADEFWLAMCLDHVSEEEGDDCVVLEPVGRETCEIIRKLASEHGMLPSKCSTTKEKAKQTVPLELRKRK
jgi:hypothetical protein